MLRQKYHTARLRVNEYVDSLNRSNDPLDFVLMTTRLLTPFLTVLFIAVLLGSQLNKHSDRIYVVRLDTSTIDIFSGLYKSLGSSISSENRTEHFGEGLTTSQIIALTNYTTSLISNTPDYISSSLYSTCSHYTYRWTYNKAAPKDPHSATRVSAVSTDGFDFENTTIVCYDSVLYDYRGLINSNNLGILLTLTEEDGSEDNFLSDSQYQQNLQKTNSQLREIPKLMITSAALQAVMIGLTVFFYSIRRYNGNIRITKAAGHIHSVLSLINFILVTVSSVTMNVVLKGSRSRINAELSAYNIALHFGPIWFSFLWIIFVTSLVNMCCWIGPLWCTTPDSVALDDDMDTTSLFSTRDPFTDDSAINLPSMANISSVNDSRYPSKADLGDATIRLYP